MLLLLLLLQLLMRQYQSQPLVVDLGVNLGSSEDTLKPINDDDVAVVDAVTADVNKVAYDH
jgi:homospermidine synthase